MQEPGLFVLADRRLNEVVQQIRDDQWSLPIPEWIRLASTTDRSALTLRTLIDYHAYDDVWVPDIVAGRTMAEVGVDRWKAGELLGDDPKAAFARIVERSVAAVEALSPADLDRTAHLSFGDFTVREYFWQITQFRTFRAYELAVLIGADPTLPVELVRGVRAQLEPHIEAWRAIGVFAPEVPVPADASEQDRLLGLSGRRPRG
ncbi:MAG TPA: hypothetical protein VFH64_11470 [Amnibacterium sp.]|nr:hypothetical protein [Amnibacterium sp.]